MKSQRAIVVAVSIAIAVSGCATASRNITPAYVSPNQYSTYDCAQLAAEGGRIQTRVTQLGGRLDQAANNDAGIMAVGLVLFWPILFALGGTKEQEAEFARLKGEYEAVEQASIMKKCVRPADSVTASAEIPAATVALAPQPALVPITYAAAPALPAPVLVATASPVKAVMVAGESKYMFSAEQYAKAAGCVQPVATMVVRQSMNETFSVDCRSKETMMVRCENGACRAMQ